MKQDKIKIKYSLIDVSQIRESDINPQVIGEKEFGRLVKTLKRDGTLTSTTLLFEEAPDKYRCVSGHHRIKAARKANINQIPAIIIRDVDESTLTRLQLQHNDIHGEPDKDLVLQLQQFIEGEERELVNFIGDDFIIKEDVFDTKIVLYEYVIFCLLPESKEEFKQIIDEISIETNTENYLIEKEDYQALKVYLTEAFRAGFKTPGKALRRMLDVVNNHKEEWQNG